MFEIKYKIVCSEYDEFVGQNGFFQIKCNNYLYGEMYPEEIEELVDKVSIFDWLVRILKVAKYLDTKQFVALSDVESYNSWIAFQMNDEDVIISIIKAQKKDNSCDIEFDLENISNGDWENQVISYKQFRNEILEKTKEYINFISENNSDEILIDKITKTFEKLILPTGEI